MNTLLAIVAVLANVAITTPAWTNHNRIAGSTPMMTNFQAWATSMQTAVEQGGGSGDAATSNQVAGVSAQVAVVDAKVSALTPSVSYPGTCHMTFTLGGELPTGAVAEEMLGGAYVVVKVENNVYRYPITSFASGATISTLVSASAGKALRAWISFECPTIVSEQYLFTTKFMYIRDGGNYAIPLTLRRADENLFAIGRGQRISDTSTMSSFLFTRDCSSTNNYSPTTLFGYYYVTNGVTTWVNETGVNDGHPLISDGVITGEQGDFETRVFPWAQAEKRVVYVNFSDGSYGNDYHFTWIPMYYWRLEDVTVPVRTYTAATDAWTTNNVAFRIHWISKTKLPGFSLPPWAYIHAYDSANSTWNTLGVKDGFYYARYDSVTQGGKVRSKPFATMDSEYRRHDITVMCHALNQYSCYVTGPTCTNQQYAIDGSNRLWAAPMYENYAPFRELAYIQFGASMKSVFYGGSRTNTDSLESAFETAGDSIKSFATGSGTSANFAWLYIWNPFYGCEGAVMSDASYIAGKDENNVNYGEWWVCPDRAADIGGATTVTAIEAAGGFPLSYRCGGAGITSMESARCIDETSLQSAIYWFPGNTTAKCSVRVTDESGWYGGAPGSTGTNVYGNWLSSHRGAAAQLGLWCVRAGSGPSSVDANSWGSRPSFAPYHAE